MLIIRTVCCKSTERIKACVGYHRALLLHYSALLSSTCRLGSPYQWLPSLQQTSKAIWRHKSRGILEMQQHSSLHVIQLWWSACCEKRASAVLCSDGEVLALVMSTLCFGIGNFGGDHSLESGALSYSGCVWEAALSSAGQLNCLYIHRRSPCVCSRPCYFTVCWGLGVFIRCAL